MARGWESKSVEAQQAEAGDWLSKSGSNKSGSNKSAANKSDSKMTADEAARWREKENLRLSRQRVLKQLERSANPRYRQLLQNALADLDEKLLGLKE